MREIDYYERKEAISYFYRNYEMKDNPLSQPLSYYIIYEWCEEEEYIPFSMWFALHDKDELLNYETSHEKRLNTLKQKSLIKHPEKLTENSYIIDWYNKDFILFEKTKEKTK